MGLSRSSESTHREGIYVCKIQYLLHSLSLAAQSSKKKDTKGLHNYTEDLTTLQHPFSLSLLRLTTCLVHRTSIIQFHFKHEETEAERIAFPKCLASQDMNPDLLILIPVIEFPVISSWPHIALYLQCSSCPFLPSHLTSQFLKCYLTFPIYPTLSSIHLPKPTQKQESAKESGTYKGSVCKQKNHLASCSHGVPFRVNSRLILSVFLGPPVRKDTRNQAGAATRV